MARQTRRKKGRSRKRMRGGAEMGYAVITENTPVYKEENGVYNETEKSLQINEAVHVISKQEFSNGWFSPTLCKITISPNTDVYYVNVKHVSILQPQVKGVMTDSIILRKKPVDNKFFFCTDPQNERTCNKITGDVAGYKYNNFYLVYNTYTPHIFGYVKEKYMELIDLGVDPGPDTQKMIKSGGPLRLRMKPTTSQSEDIYTGKTIMNKSEVTVLRKNFKNENKTSATFSKIRQGNIEGFIKQDYLENI